MAGEAAGKPAKNELSYASRLEAMKERLLATPSAIILKPKDLETNLVQLEALQNDPQDLETLALAIVKRGYR